MHISLILIPAAAYILLTLLFARRLGVKEISEALIKGHLVVFFFVAVSTEILSIFNAITFPVLLTAWLSFTLICLIALFSYKSMHGFPLPVLQRPAPLTVILVGAIAFLLAATFSAAILYPPNTWDSMTYHMSRVVHWISYNNVSFYPTAIARQNWLTPLAEFAIMHVQILTGCDMYANLIQWVSYFVLIFLGLLIANELGLNNRQQLASLDSEMATMGKQASHAPFCFSRTITGDGYHTRQRVYQETNRLCDYIMHDYFFYSFCYEQFEPVYYVA